MLPDDREARGSPNEPRQRIEIAGRSAALHRRDGQHEDGFLQLRGVWIGRSFAVLRGSTAGRFGGRCLGGRLGGAATPGGGYDFRRLGWPVGLVQDRIGRGCDPFTVGPSPPFARTEAAATRPALFGRGATAPATLARERFIRRPAPQHRYGDGEIGGQEGEQRDRRNDSTRRCPVAKATGDQRCEPNCVAQGNARIGEVGKREARGERRRGATWRRGSRRRQRA